ncbi:MAG: glycoside hydrolase family 3 protein, partial [Treponema sp.]|nr:glycoside hydrolase family 3 protein [Treponema sp.]
MRRLLLFFVVNFTFPLFSLSFSDPSSGLSPAAHAAALTDAMSDEEALAQTFMFGWVGAEPSPLIIDWIRGRKIGGVKIFGWNTGDTRLLARTVGELQQASLAGPLGIPLLVATDQEGGLVRHVKGDTSETPGNMAIGASGYPRDAYLAGYYIGKELAALGINMNFAPAVDLYTNRDSVLIGPRAFGNDPVKTGILGAAFM